MLLTWHEQLEILHFQSEGAVLLCGQERYNIEKGDIFIINTCEIHSLVYDSKNPIYDCIMVGQELYHSIQKDICEMKYISQIDNRQICFNNKILNKDIHLLVNNLLDICDKKELAYELEIKSIIFMILALLFRNEVKSQTNEEIQNTLNYKRIINALKYIEDNYAQEIKLNDLAEICNFNASHFCRIFKSITGKTAIQYINEYRISKAKVLLKTTDLNVAEIADKVGFSDNCYFSRFFKKCFNVTPTEYRSNYMQSTSNFIGE